MSTPTRFLIASVLASCATTAIGQTVNPPKDVCQKELMQLSAAQAALEKTAASTPRSTLPKNSPSQGSTSGLAPPEPPQKCDWGVRFTCDSKLAVWNYKVDVPEVKSNRREWSATIPETSLERKKMAADVPVTKCQNKKVGQYPEFTCNKAVIPECKVKWSDAVTKLCWVEFQRKEVKLGIPTVQMQERKFSFDNPELTMKTREFSMHYPRCQLKDACTGEACKTNPACQNDTRTPEQYSRDERQKVETFGKAIGNANQAVLRASSNVYQCHAKKLLATRAQVESQGKKYLSQANAAVQQMIKAGLFTELTQETNSIVSKSRAISDSLKSIDAQIEALRANERQLIEKGVEVSLEENPAPEK